MSMNSHPHDKDIAIVFGGRIGDAIVFLDIVDALQEALNRNGKELLILCKPVVFSFVKAARPDIQASLLSFDLSDYSKSASYRSEKADALRRLSRCTIVSPHQSKYAEAVSLLSRASVRLELREETKINRLDYGYWLNKLAYNQRIFVEPGEMAYVRYKKLMSALGVEGYRSTLTPFPVNAESAAWVRQQLTEGRRYCAIAPTTNEPEKSWEFGKFLSVIEWLTERTDLAVCLVGGAEGEGLYESACGRLGSRSSRLVDCMDKTDFGQWIELVRGAEFCFGNDSATMHIAAHVGTPSVCVTPGFAYGYVQPYVLDEVGETDEVPVCLYAFKECFGCYSRDYRRCSGNPACRAAVKAGKPYLCIQDIPVEQAIGALEPLLRRIEGE